MRRSGNLLLERTRGLVPAHRGRAPERLTLIVAPGDGDGVAQSENTPHEIPIKLSALADRPHGGAGVSDRGWLWAVSVEDRGETGANSNGRYAAASSNRRRSSSRLSAHRSTRA